MATSSTRTRAWARRDVLKVLAATKRTIGITQTRWDVRGTVYQPHPDGSSLMGTWVPRPAGQYPENQAAHWDELIRTVDNMTDDLAALRQYAQDRRAELASR